jgi:hypothetical protein
MRMKMIILGFKCSRTTKLRDTCLELLGKWDNGSSLEVIEDETMFAQFGIKNTPTLVVDNIVLFQGSAMSGPGIETMIRQHEKLNIHSM